MREAEGVRLAASWQSTNVRARFVGAECRRRMAAQNGGGCCGQRSSTAAVTSTTGHTYIIVHRQGFAAGACSTIAAAAAGFSSAPPPAGSRGLFVPAPASSVSRAYTAAVAFFMGMAVGIAAVSHDSVSLAYS